MRFIDAASGRWATPTLLVLLTLLTGCSQTRLPPSAGSPSAATPSTPSTPTTGAPGSFRNPNAGETPPAWALPAWRRARDWRDWQRQAAERIVAANPGRTYAGQVPETLLAIPVLEVELNGDGSVRRIVVVRKPRQALDTVQMAIDAVHRAAPFGSVEHLPRPWVMAETFLFDDDRRFKLRTLDD